MQRIAFAHALRGLAALSVLLSHFCGVFWKSPDAVANLLHLPALDVAVPDYFSPFLISSEFNYGSFGVAVFFLISGFVIPFSLERLSYRGFLIARFFRIYPVYIVSLAVGVGCVGLLGSVLSSGHPFPFSQEQILWQASLLRGWRWVPSLDGLSWTLEIELVFYAIAALLSPFIVGKGRKSVLAFYVIGATIFCLFGSTLLKHTTGLYETMLIFLTYALPFTFYMLIGTFFYLHAKNAIKTSSLLIGAALCLYGFTIGCASHVALKPLALGSYHLAIGLFALLYATRAHFTSNRFLDRMADISYPLYAIHALSGYTLMYALTKSGAAPLVCSLAALTVTVALATLTHYLVELPTMRFGKKLARRWFP